MNSRSILAVVIVLAALGAGYCWTTRLPAPSDAQDAPSLAPLSVAAAASDPASTLMPISEPEPAPLEDVASRQIITDAQTLAAPSASQLELQRKYANKAVEELRAAAEAVQTDLAAASKARFDELWPQFPQLLAEGRYGARVGPKEEPIHIKNTPGARVLFYSQRTARNATGVEETHCLELCPAEEPTMASLFEELLWVREAYGKVSNHG